MLKRITAVAVAAGIVTIAAATAATTASAQAWLPMPDTAFIHNPGGVERAGNLCWVDADSYKEIDVHGYWRVCGPASAGMRSATIWHHRRVNRAVQ